MRLCQHNEFISGRKYVQVAERHCDVVKSLSNVNLVIGRFGCLEKENWSLLALGAVENGNGRG